MVINHLISIWIYLKDNGINTKDTHENIADQIPEFDNLESNQDSDGLEQFLKERENTEVSCSSQNSTSTEFYFYSDREST